MLILHNAGKTKGSKQYRGSSNIKAAVDTVYFLEWEPRAGKIHRLTLETFKSRFAPGQNFAMEFQAGPGVHPAGNAKEDQPAVARPIGGRTCQAAPRINGTKIKKLAKAASHQQAQVDECLDRGPYQRCPGKGNSTLYTLVEQTLAPSDFPIFPPL